MAEDHEREADDEMLRDFLRAQRESVLAIVEGLDEEDWHRPVVPTGWTPAGLVEHLGGAEWHWFQGVVAGKQPELPADVDEDRPPYDRLTVVFTTDEPSTEVVAFYRDQCEQSEAVLATRSEVAEHLVQSGDEIAALVAGLTDEQLALFDGRIALLAAIAARHANSHRSEVAAAIGIERAVVHDEVGA